MLRRLEARTGHGSQLGEVMRPKRTAQLLSHQIRATLDDPRLQRVLNGGCDEEGDAVNERRRSFSRWLAGVVSMSCHRSTHNRSARRWCDAAFSSQLPGSANRG